MTHPNAGQLSATVINRYKLEKDFYSPAGLPSKVKFGTSGHRGKLGAAFSYLHAQAIAQAVARMHHEKGIHGPVLVGGDTRLMSADTAEICAEVLAANGIQVILARGPLPTPVFSFEILSGRACACLNGTASHNPPDDMGLKYNPAHGGPADSAITSEIEKYANEYMDKPAQIKRISLRKAKAAGLLLEADLVSPYIERLARKVDIDAIKNSGLRIGIHGLGGASLAYYSALIKQFDISNMEIVDKTADPTFGFIPLDHDGQIRMDPSSQYPMSPLLSLVGMGKYDFAGASDPDADRFGAATREGGLISPNHALSVALEYLISNRPDLPQTLGAGRTIGTTHMLDRICAAHGRQLDEVNVGFKYFVDGFAADRYLMAGEESAGMSVYRWTTEKDGILAVLLLAEVMARTGKDIAALYQDLTAKHGVSSYRRVDVPLTEETRARIKGLKGESIGAKTVAGEKIVKVRDSDGIKVYMENSWALVRLSGTEPIAKLYAETFSGPEHLERVLTEGGALFGLQV